MYKQLCFQKIVYVKSENIFVKVYISEKKHDIIEKKNKSDKTGKI